MWSDRPSAARLDEWIARLHSILPAPSSAARSKRVRLSGQATISQLTQLLHDRPGFTFLNSGPHGPCVLHKSQASIAYDGTSAQVAGPLGSIEIAGRGFDILEAVMNSWQGAGEAILAGFLSYDLGAELEDLGGAPTATFAFPKFYFGLFDSSLVMEDDVWYLRRTDAWHPQDLESLVSEAEALLSRASAIEFSELPTTPRPQGNDTLTSHPDRAAFEASVQEIVRTIHAGDIFQTNLCRSIETSLKPGAEWDLFQKLRAINPARYEAFIKLEAPDSEASQTLFSISPELFLNVTTEGNETIVASSPIKGTRARGRDAAKDAALSADLLASEKDRAELAMIVDVVRNDLARVCETGSVEVVKHAELMSLPTVHHTFSTVKGKLRADHTLVDLLRAAFPAASISGAPKIEAMRVAMREENQLRGPCMGAIGWISLGEPSMEFSVAIRTAFTSEGRVRYYAGCGITADSLPGDEFVESRHKAAAFVRALAMEQDPNW